MCACRVQSAALPLHCIDSTACPEALAPWARGGGLPPYSLGSSWLRKGATEGEPLPGALLLPVRPPQVLAVNVATLFDSTFLCWARSRADWAAGLKRWLRVRASGSSGGAEASSKGAEVGGGGAAKWERLASSESVAELELEGGVPQQGAPAAGSQQRVKALAVSDPIPGAS